MYPIFQFAVAIGYCFFPYSGRVTQGLYRISKFLEKRKLNLGPHLTRIGVNCALKQGKKILQ